MADVGRLVSMLVMAGAGWWIPPPRPLRRTVRHPDWQACHAVAAGARRQNPGWPRVPCGASSGTPSCAACSLSNLITGSIVARISSSSQHRLWMAVAQILRGRKSGLAEIVRNELLPAAAGLERAPRRRVHRRGNVAFQHDVLLDDAGIGDRNRRQQGLGIGMIGRREDLVRLPCSTMWPRYMTTTRSAM